MSTFLLLVSILLGLSCVDSNTNGTPFLTPKEFTSQLLGMIVSPSYIVNISICGALDIQNSTLYYNNSKTVNVSNTTARLSNFHMYYNGSLRNYSKIILETYLAYPLLTHLLSYFMATTAAFLDFAFFGGLALSAYHFVSPAFLLYLPLALIFLVVFLKRLIVNIMSCRYAWTRHTNYILDNHGRIFVNHDDVLIEDKGKIKLGNQGVEAAKVILGGREATTLRKACVEEWSW
ncbi:large glycoprotein [Kibale red colobus virus 2]|uniref:Large glycoprotein n=1 Tax=Kibale red colobus virus 2 TaxID=1936072 RepID=X2D693_9NIDO|nr:large glycoprotein [Kibale red colobus virus 2]AHH54254.1 large glycoprotein [Kibale red colobus virus 2]